MKIPPNMTKEMVMAVIQGIAEEASEKYLFSYHGTEDIKQEAYVAAMSGLENYRGSRPLGDFLRTHIFNRLMGQKRNSYERNVCVIPIHLLEEEI